VLAPYLVAVVHLAALARAGRLDFETVYAEVREPVARYALRLLGDPDEAADVAQETALALWRGLDRFEGRSSVTTWALGIVTNLARKRMRRRRLEPRALDPQVAQEAAGAGRDRSAEALAAREDLARLQDALGALPERQRAAFLLATEQRLPYAEIAATLEISVANVKVSVHRARKKLSELLEVPA